jgi:protein dithiol oxidoreductase (disulfide-forming)
MKRFAAFVFAVLLLAPLLVLAQGKPAYTELKPPLPVDNDGRIQVLEFFWYGCIHCYNLEPTVEKWEKTLPKDVEFRRVPAIFNDRWALDAQIFYAFEALGVLDKLHRPFFDAIHRDHLRTDNQQALAEWLQKQGVDPKKFNDVMKSFGVQSKTRRAAQLTAAYKIDGTPELAVQGRYTVSAEQGRTQQGMFDAVDYLVEQLRHSGKK